VTDFGRRPTVLTASVQHGRVTINDFMTEGLATIDEVDLDKSILYMLGVDADDSMSNAAPGKLDFFSATRVRATRIDMFGTWVFGFQVVEFNCAIKSVQRGEDAFEAGEKSVEITITAVDKAKSILSHLGAEDASSWPLRVTFSLELTNSTTITARRNQSGDAVGFGYELLEFT